MPGLFSITALAIAAERANAVGAVRLTCLPEGLEVELLRAAGFTEGFAPSSVAESVSFTVPYTAVRGLVRKGRTLCLALDPVVAKPYNRFALVRFTDDPAEALAGTYRARLVARWVSYLLPAPLGGLAALLAPARLAGGALGAMSLAVLVSLAAWVVLRELFRWLTWGGPVSDAYRDAFEIELAGRLGLAPAAPAVASPWDTPLPVDTRAATPRPGLASLAGLTGLTGLPGAASSGGFGGSGSSGGFFLPLDSRRARIGALVAAVTLGAVGVMAFLKHYAAPRDITPPGAQLAAGVVSAAQRMARIQVRPPGSDRPRCVCRHAASPLWKDGMPILSVLLSSQVDDGSGVVAPTVEEGKKPRYNFDLAVVNNAAHPLHDVRVVLTFARRDADGQRAGVTDRGLFWEGWLSPARAIKWHVRAPGTEMRIDTSAAGTLEESGAEAASPDAFFDLLSARYRVVRIHAAMMLAYLRDPRAESAVRSLGALAPGEVPIVTRIQRAAAPVIACDIEAKDGHLEMCVFNSTERPAEGLTAREVAEAGAPGRAFPIEGAVPVHEGARVSVPFDGGSGNVPVELVIEAAGASKPAPPEP